MRMAAWGCRDPPQQLLQLSADVGDLDDLGQERRRKPKGGGGQQDLLQCLTSLDLCERVVDVTDEHSDQWLGFEIRSQDPHCAVTFAEVTQHPGVLALRLRTAGGEGDALSVGRRAHQP